MTRVIKILTVLIFIPSLAFAAIAKQTTDFDDTSSADTSETTNITVDSGSNLVLVVTYGGADSNETDRSISSISCNSGAFTLAAITGAYTATSTTTTDIWIAYAPTVGTYDCICTFGGTNLIGNLNYIVFSGVKQTDQPDDVGTNSDASEPLTIDIITTVSGAVIIDAALADPDAATSMTPLSGQTETMDADSASITFGSGFEIVTTATTYTQQWEFADATGSWKMSSVAFAPASDGIVSPVIMIKE